jgi:hypothetical protein
MEMRRPSKNSEEAAACLYRYLRLESCRKQTLYILIIGAVKLKRILTSADP